LRKIKKHLKMHTVAQYFGIGNTKEQEAAMKKQYEAQIELNKAQAEREKDRTSKRKSRRRVFSKIIKFLPW
jgi:siroheme synthase (precorrin-2 oxidase/ferrochelatase)